MTNLIPETILQVTIGSWIIFGATMLFKKIARNRLSPAAHVMLWTVLILRLVIPVTIDTGFHFIELPAAYEVQADAPEEHWAAPQSAIFPEEHQTESRLRITPSGIVPESATSKDENYSPLAVNAVSALQTGFIWDWSWQRICLFIWLAGCLLMAFSSLTAYLDLKRGIRKRMVASVDSLHLLFQEVLSEKKISQRILLAVQSDLAGPGLMYPNIVLIPEQMQYMDAEAVKMAFRHELTHFARRDHLFALLLSILRIIWWFNPVVWLAVREIREDLETACDNAVVENLGQEGRLHYAQTVLSMFGKTETNPAVLGMAFGGTRESAERRIRGIYMKSKSKLTTKAAAILLTGVLGACCFTTACQPTLAAATVMSQEESAPAEAITADTADNDIAPAAVSEPLAYAMQERWSEDIDMGSNFHIKADVDIMVPQNASYPVQKLKVRPLTQEKADELIEYFAPGLQWYAGETAVLTKSDWQAMILEQREALAAAERDGDSESAAVIRQDLDEMTAACEAAPEVVKPEPADTSFSYRKDYTGALMEEEGPRFINIHGTKSDNSVVKIDARQESDEDLSERAYFFYNNCDYSTESMDQYNEQIATDPDRDHDEETAERAAERRSRLSLYAQSPIDLSDAENRVMEILGDLGITGMQVVESTRALLAPSSADETAMQEFSEHGVYMMIYRQNGGIPCIASYGVNMLPEDASKQYSAPFSPEEISMVLDENGKVRYFSWESPAEVEEQLVTDSTLISIDDAKKQLTDNLYRQELAISEEYLRDHTIEYDVEEMRLVMTYVNVQNEPDKALAIPAWYMRAVAHGFTDDEDAATLNTQDLIISALDGALVLQPGALQSGVTV